MNNFKKSSLTNYYVRVSQLISLVDTIFSMNFYFFQLQALMLKRQLKSVNIFSYFKNWFYQKEAIFELFAN